MKSIFNLQIFAVRMLAAIALVALTACEGPVPAPSVTLRVGTYRSQDYLPYYVMQERGLDRKHGLTFVEHPVASGAAGIDALVTGQTDMSIAAIVPVLTAAARGLIPDRVVVVAANSFADPEHRAIGVLVAHTVQGWKDLAGKKIGTNNLDSLMTAAPEIRLKEEGVSGYAFVEITAANRGLALAGGNIAAACMAEPYLTQSILRGDGKLLAWVVGGPPFERMELSNIMFSAEFRRRNPEGVKALLRAHLEAVRWINANPEKARQVLGKRLNLSPEIAKGINLARWSADARSDAALNDQTQQVLLRHGLIPRPFDTRMLYDETLLGEVLKEKR